jgi:isopenicillin-N epimerase
MFGISSPRGRLTRGLNHDAWRQPGAAPALWALDASVTFLNHGSFGACPQAVLQRQHELRLELERQPIDFLWRKLESRLDAARRGLARFVGADAEDLAFVPNATTGVNTVLRSLPFRAGDELLVTNQEYNACRNALDFVAAAGNLRVIVIPLPFPVASAEEVIGAVMGRVTRRTRLALLDHVTSQTALVLPLRELCDELARRHVEVLVDGAHAPGMIPLHLNSLGAAYYTGNCHKWLCAPKGAAFLWVRPDRQERVRPLVISHGANSTRQDRSRFQLEFGWTGTFDPTAALCVPEAIRFVGSLLPGGWRAVMQRNRHLALAAREILGQALGMPAPCPEAMIGSMAALPLPKASRPARPRSPLFMDPLQDRLRQQGIEVPIIFWPQYPHRLLRVSAHLYNGLDDYEHLAAHLTRSFARGQSRS